MNGGSTKVGQRQVIDMVTVRILSFASVLRQSMRCKQLVTPSASNLHGYHAEL
jgi:hypothetical protein